MLYFDFGMLVFVFVFFFFLFLVTCILLPLLWRNEISYDDRNKKVCITFALKSDAATEETLSSIVRLVRSTSKSPFI